MVRDDIINNLINDMTQKEWNDMKERIGDYLI